MTLTRRGLLRGLLALPFVPLALRALARPEWGPGPAYSTFDIVNATIEGRMRRIASSVHQDNQLMWMLRHEHAGRDCPGCVGRKSAALKKRLQAKYKGRA